MKKVTLGGERLGSGKKMDVELHGFERSTHDLSYIWRSTMAAGTLVPFLKELALPGDTFDIHLNCDIKTHPTIGPLFGSYKVQLDVFSVPIRLYHSALHNNRLGIGMNMAQIKFPKFTLFGAPNYTAASGELVQDIDNAQVNPSALPSYLGIRGIGSNDGLGLRAFNAIPFLAYWDIFKNYYANKQEEDAWVIHKTLADFPRNVTSVQVAPGTVTVPQYTQDPPPSAVITIPNNLWINYTTGSAPDPDNIYLFIEQVGWLKASDVYATWVDTPGVRIVGSSIKAYNIGPAGATRYLVFWEYATLEQINNAAPELVSFPLTNIDTMRERILQSAYNAEFSVNAQNLEPYSLLLQYGETNESIFAAIQYSQEGLAVKTYQSDLFNNWLSTEWIDGTGGINEITAIDTSGGSFNIDTLNLSKKVYDMLNRIAVSDGSYQDWLDAVYDHEAWNRPETPVYVGGLIKELVFQEVVSNSATTDGFTGQEAQPLGTLAGKGVMSSKHKGGDITIRIDEPSYIMGIVSLTPRVDYSQGNKWDITLDNMDDLHKPNLDQIGFQELIQEQMAYWTTNIRVVVSPPSIEWDQYSAGKQPAWINYMTNVNEVRGNFAIANNEMFMTLNRRYEAEWDGTDTVRIKDLTTYIDPSIFNNIFAQTSLDAQNFWTQISIDMIARRKMSAKVMPNL